MRVTVYAHVERSDGSCEMVEVLSLARSVELAPGSGMGLALAETRQLTTKLQEVVLHEQAQETVAYLSRCRCCSEPLGVKSRRKLTYRTAYGKATLPNPQLYSRCTHCGTKFDAAKTFSPMSQALPERTHPQWIWLQSRVASDVLSHGDFLPGARLYWRNEVGPIKLAPSCAAGRRTARVGGASSGNAGLRRSAKNRVEQRCGTVDCDTRDPD